MDGEPFDLTIPQKYIDAMNDTDKRITAQMKVWETYVAELSNANTLQRLANQMNMITEPITRQLELHATLRAKV